MKKTVSLFLTLIILFLSMPDGIFPIKAYDIHETEKIINGIIDHSKELYGTSGSLLSGGLPEKSGSADGDWYAVALSRYNASDDYASYLRAMTDYVNSSYLTQGKLSAAKSTEWHRIILAVLSCGGDPLRFCTADSGMINLVADGIYNRGNTISLGKQGITGWIWGLTALDSMHYQIPDGSYYTRENIIDEILSKQLGDGGFSLSGSSYDSDITANAITALAPYYNENAGVHSAVDSALSVLSANQGADGDFQSFGTFNAESTAQVMIALTTMKIDILSDTRFIKENHTVYDGLMKYRCSDGGFSHTADTDSSSEMASVQTMMALVSLYRYNTSQSSFFDFGTYDYSKVAAETQTAVSAVATADAAPDITAVDVSDFQKITVQIDSATDTSATKLSSDNRKTDVKTKAAVSGSVSTTVSEAIAETATEKISGAGNACEKSGNSNIKIILIISTLLIDSAIVLILKNKKKLRNNLLIIFSAAAAIIFIVISIDIKSADKYYSSDSSQDKGTGKTVMLSIDCISVFDNMDKLDKSVKDSGAVPDDGIILSAVDYEINEGDSVYDILQRAVKENKIQIAFQGSSQNSLGTVYIQSINNINEFSCGELSGWIFTVNGKQAGVGCNDYIVSDGDVIRWAFSCDLGRDIS